MTTNLVGKNLTQKEQRSFTSYLQKKFDRIEEFTAGMPDDAVHLHATCEKFPTNAAFKVTLELRLNGERMYVTEDDHKINEVVDLAVDKLIHQLRTARDKAQGRAKRSRGTRRALKTQAAPEDEGPAPKDRSSIFRELQPYLARLTKQIGDEIRRMEMSGELAQGQLTSESVVDSLIIFLYDHYTEQPEDLSFTQWVEQRATYFLQTMARSEKEINATWVHLEHPTHERDAARPSELGNTQEDFYQPDEARPMSSVQDSYAPDPLEALELKAEIDEMLERLHVHTSIADRDAFMLHYVDERSLGEIARSQGRDEAEIDRGITNILSQLRGTIVKETAS